MSIRSDLGTSSLESHIIKKFQERIREVTDQKAVAVLMEIRSEAGNLINESKAMDVIAAALDLIIPSPSMFPRS